MIRGHAFSKLARQAVLILLGTAGSQFFILVSTPYLTRVHSPAEFGALALLMTIANLVLVTGCLRFDLAIPAADDEDATALYGLCAVLALVLAGLAAVACLLPWGWLTHHPVTELIGRPALIPSVVLGAILYQLSCASLTRSARFMALGGLRASQGILFAALACFASTGLVWAHSLSFLLGGLAMALVTAWGQRAELARLSWRRIWGTAVKLRIFPQYSLSGALLDVVGFSACIWIISSQFGLTMAGHYSQLQRLIGAPMLLVSMSLSQVMLKQTADEARAGRPLWILIRNVALALAGGAVVLMILLYFFGSWALLLFLGPKWRVDTRFVCLVALAVFVRATVSPLSPVLTTVRRLRAAFCWQACYFLSTCIVLPWLARHLTFDDYVLGYAIHEAVHYGIYFLIIRKVTQGAHWVTQAPA